MKKILFIIVFSCFSCLYSSEGSESCQLWFELSVVTQNATNTFDKEKDGNEGSQDVKIDQYLTELDRIFEEMVERKILASQNFKVPHKIEAEYWKMVNDFLKRLSLKYGTMVSGELLSIGYKAYFKYNWDSDESKEVGYVEITIRLPEDELKEFEKRFASLSV